MDRILLRRKRCATTIVSLLLTTRLGSVRRFWMKQWLKERENRSHMSLLRELRQSHHDDLINYLQISDKNFRELLRLVSPYITKANTRMRQAISAEERLTATLRFLATGQSFDDLKFRTRISPQSLGIIIPETSQFIYKTLKDLDIQLPDSFEGWQEVARDFENRWNFPNCGGAIDGKHVRIKKPSNSGSYFYNYKGYFSIVLMAIVNADYEFIYVNVGWNGRISDGGIIECTSFYKKLISKQLNLPSVELNKKNLNFVFVADNAFALHENILKLYPQKNLSREECIFNYRLSRARRVVENAFGILSSLFRVFHSEMNMKPEKIDYIVLAACALHNFLKKKEKGNYMPTASLDVEDLQAGQVVHDDRDGQLSGLQYGFSRNVCDDAKRNREQYKSYFVNDGAVFWQDNFVDRSHQLIRIVIPCNVHEHFHVVVNSCIRCL